MASMVTGLAGNDDAENSQASKPVAHPTALRLADAYTNSLPADQARHLLRFHEFFLSKFFWGFLNPEGSMSGGTEADRRGFKAGQEYRRSHPDKLKEVLEGFGYTATEAEGIWTLGEEQSNFQARNRPKERWWFIRLKDAECQGIPAHGKIPNGKIPIHITGFLSPEGQHGHLGAYDHQFIATKVTRIKPD